MQSDDLTQIEMPNFEEIEEVENIEVTVKEECQTSSAEPKRGRKPKADKVVLTEEQKKEQMNKYYEANKAHRLDYKKAQREKVEQDVMVLTTQPIEQYIENQGKKKIANIDYLRYNGAKRTLTINQPSERLLNILKAMEYNIDEITI